ncbi:MAG TPA: phosphotransferase [Pseudomonadota bacterium]|jgi:hypothetical protein|nr:phosphotransferase [Pseudomonadota bacterium]HNO67802.1 phosphotransferase [Pseudomonadota bacterium]
MSPSSSSPTALARHVLSLYPESQIKRISALGTDDASDETTKGLGYGRPVRVDLEGPDGPRRLVFHTARPDDFGHDRRSDRAQAMLLLWDSADRIPFHTRAVDVGALRQSGDLISLRDAGEFYVVTEWCDGNPYADDLRRVAMTGHATPTDLERAEVLARALIEIHAAPGSHPAAYTRAIRDLLGHGEAIFGLVDSYPATTPGIELDELRRIEEKCLSWRWKLRGQTDRLRKTHGDFHPFNILFDDAGKLHLLDTSRGSEGDPADDVACLAINYLFFGLEHRRIWEHGLGRLWDRFWQVYLAESEQIAAPNVLHAVAPYFAWRGLVLASPLWYPNLAAADRRRILAFVFRVLDAAQFDPAWGHEAMQ